MNPFEWFLIVLGMVATPYAILAAYRYGIALFGRV